jgi:hypothetical protein
MIVIGLIAGYVTLLMLGFGITMLIMRGAARFNAVEICCLSWLFGTGGISILLWLGGNCLSGFGLQFVVTAVCVTAAVTGWSMMRRSTGTCAFPRPGNFLEWILAVILMLEVAAVFVVAFKTPLGWDGLLDWEIKARYAFLNGNVLPAHYHDSGRVFSHPDYPPAIPFTELWLYIWMGAAHQFWIKTIFPMFYAAGAGLLALLCARLTGKTWAGYVAAALFFFVPQATLGMGGAVYGYVDFPISVLYLATIGYLLYWIKSQSACDFRIYAVCLALLPWFKREGAILWLIAAVAGVAIILMQRKARTTLLALIPGAVIILAWQFYLRAMHAPASQEFLPLSLTTLSHNAGRFGRILQILCLEISDPGNWSIFWLIAAAAIIYMLLRIRNLQSAVLFCAIVLPIMAYLSVYIFSAWPDYLQHVGTSLARLLTHVVPVLWIAIAGAFSSPLRKESHPRNLIP